MIKMTKCEHEWVIDGSPRLQCVKCGMIKVWINFINEIKDAQEEADRIKFKQAIDMLECPLCGKKFKQISKHVYEVQCDCFDKRKLRVSVG